MFDLELDPNSEAIKKLNGSTVLVNNLLENVRKGIYENIDKTNLKPMGSLSQLESIWFNAEFGTIGKSGSDIEFVDKRELKKDIKIKVISDTVGEIIVNNPAAESLSKGGKTVVKKSNPDFSNKIDQYIKENQSSLSENDVSRVKRLKSLSQLSVVMPETHVFDSKEKGASSIIKDYLES